MKVQEKPLEYDESTLKEAVIEWYEENGKAPRRRDFGRHPDYPSEAPYRKRWGSLRKACNEILGEYDEDYSFEHSAKDSDGWKKYDSADFRDCIIAWYVEMGTAPKGEDFKNLDGFPAPQSYQQRLGQNFRSVRDETLAKFDPKYVPPKSSYTNKGVE
jgi:hypothetical protein